MSSTTILIEGRERLNRELKRLGGPKARQVARKVVTSAMRPVLGTARSNAPVGETGRLRASLGQLATRNKRGDAFSSRVGTRRDFVYRNEAGQKIVSGRGKGRDKAIAKGATQDRKTAQQYARLIEFGTDSKGRIRRKAGASHFLENAIQTHQTQIIEAVESELNRHLQTST